MTGILHSPASDHGRSDSFSPLASTPVATVPCSWRIWNMNATDFLFADPPVMLAITMVIVGVARRIPP